MISRTPRRTLCFGAAVLLLVLATPARGEVGVCGSTGQGGLDRFGLYLMQITDDPDPILWSQLYPTGANHFALNPQGDSNGDGPPALLLHPITNLPVVAWARNSATGFDIVISRFVNGSWSEPEVVAGGPEDEADPVLVAAPDGGVHLFYWVTAPTPRVMYRHAPADLSSWSEPVQVSAEGEAACRPWAEFHGGVLRVIYEVHQLGFGQAPREVVLARKEEGGFVPEVIAVTNNADPVWPRVHSHAGRIWVDWIDANGEMAWTRQDGQGHWETVRYEPFSGSIDREFLVRAAIRVRAVQEP